MRPLREALISKDKKDWASTLEKDGYLPNSHGNDFDFWKSYFKKNLKGLPNASIGITGLITDTNYIAFHFVCKNETTLLVNKNLPVFKDMTKEFILNVLDVCQNIGWFQKQKEKNKFLAKLHFSDYSHYTIHTSKDNYPNFRKSLDSYLNHMFEEIEKLLMAFPQERHLKSIVFEIPFNGSDDLVDPIELNFYMKK